MKSVECVTVHVPVSHSIGGGGDGVVSVADAEATAGVALAPAYLDGRLRVMGPISVAIMSAAALGKSVVDLQYYLAFLCRKGMERGM